jgi:enhancer of polycomb-like protein
MYQAGHTANLRFCRQKLNTSAAYIPTLASTAANQFTHYMDQRDKEWLHRDNEEAQGKGTSAQGTLSTLGTSTCLGMSSRSAKARGKGDWSRSANCCVQGLVRTSDAIVREEKTEYLHHVRWLFLLSFHFYLTSLSGPWTRNGLSFISRLSRHILVTAAFTSFIVPSWIPQPPHLARIARVIYPYWNLEVIQLFQH